LWRGVVVDDADRPLAGIAAEDGLVAEKLGSDHFPSRHVGQRFDLAVEGDVRDVAMDGVYFRESAVRAFVEPRRTERAQLQAAVRFDDDLIARQQDFLSLNTQLDRVAQLLAA